MRTLGILGGMSWESSAVYYCLLNQGVAARRGGLHSASLRMASVDFAEYAALLQAQQWGEIGQRLGQLGTGLRDRLALAHGLEPQVPDAASRIEMHRIVFDELCRGRVLAHSRERVRAMMETLAAQGCDSVVLACTEIVWLTPPEAGAWPLPLFDTTALHAAAAVDWMLEETP